MTSHTPAPWSVNGSHIYAPDGAILAQVCNPGFRAEDYPLQINARLMASAPELLAALIKAEETMRNSEYWWMTCPDRGGMDYDGIVAAIKKATQP